ncbi:DUF222 domain-containing protein [Zhihengliuella halotolerans]|uniref:DUF222 domain-containing protein n=1 Tax=Zhihengliuella halotolerans TaxID=370736 RepID=UPI000C80F2B0|nr:DUF222 domain-containing protein [Zhihengliuella halotolerans]
MAITHPSETPAAASGAAGRMREATEHLKGLCTEVDSMSDADLVRAAGAVEALGRLVDALRVRSAGEIEARSSKGLGEDRLSVRYGCRTGSELLERLTGAPGSEVRRRAGLDARTRAGLSLTGEELPARFPDIADALHSGSLGIETAELLTGMLTRVGPRADPAAVSAAEAALVATATATTATDSTGQDSATRDPAGEDPAAEADNTGTGPDAAAGDDTNTPDVAASTGVPAATYAEVKIHTQVWEAHLDQDGPDPEAARATTRRGLTLGSARDGLIPVRGNLMPETPAQLTRLLSAYLNPAARTHGTDPDPETHAGGTGGENAAATHGGADDAGDDSVADSEASTAGGGSAIVSGTPVVVDERTPAQKRHDVLASILTAAARAAETPSLGGDSATLLVHITAEDLLDSAGSANLDGIDIPAPRPDRPPHRVRRGRAESPLRPCRPHRSPRDEGTSLQRPPAPGHHRPRRRVRHPRVHDPSLLVRNPPRARPRRGRSDAHRQWGAALLVPPPSSREFGLGDPHDRRSPARESTALVRPEWRVPSGGQRAHPPRPTPPPRTTTSGTPSRGDTEPGRAPCPRPSPERGT